MANIFKPAITLFVICFVVAAALSLTHAVTKDTIEERARIEKENATRQVLADAETFTQIEDIRVLADALSGVGIVKEVYRGTKGDSLAGYAFIVKNKGYGGMVNTIIGIDDTGKITGVKMGENTETPGLGSKAGNEPFISQFIGLAPQGPLKLVKSAKAQPEDIDAASGATISSKAVTQAVQAALDVWTELMEREGKQ